MRGQFEQIFESSDAHQSTHLYGKVIPSQHRESDAEAQLTFTRNYVNALKVNTDHFFNAKQKEPRKQISSLNKKYISMGHTNISSEM